MKKNVFKVLLISAILLISNGVLQDIAAQEICVHFENGNRADEFEIHHSYTSTSTHSYIDYLGTISVPAGSLRSMPWGGNQVRYGIATKYYPIRYLASGVSTPTNPFSSILITSKTDSNLMLWIDVGFLLQNPNRTITVTISPFLLPNGNRQVSATIEDGIIR